MGSEDVVEVDWRLVDQHNEERFLAQLEEAGVVIKGHFVLRSFRHGDTFVNIKGLFPHTRAAKQLGRALAHRIQRELGYARLQQVRGVAAPAIGGIMLAHDTADWLSLMCPEFDKEILALFAEKNRDGKFFFDRGYDEYIPGQHFVIVEDVVTTGSAVRELVDLIQGLGGFVDLITFIWNRGNVTSADVGGIPIASLVTHELPTWSEEECAVDGPCAAEQAIDVKHGRGREYIEQQGGAEMA